MISLAVLIMIPGFGRSEVVIIYPNRNVMIAWTMKDNDIQSFII